MAAEFTYFEGAFTPAKFCLRCSGHSPDSARDMQQHQALRVEVQQTSSVEIAGGDQWDSRAALLTEATRKKNRRRAWQEWARRLKPSKFVMKHSLSFALNSFGIDSGPPRVNLHWFHLKVWFGAWFPLKA